MAILSKTADWHTWRDDFFPPLSFRTFLKIVLIGCAILLAWVGCGAAIAWGLITYNGCPRGGAITAGGLLPVFVVIVLNSVGVFSRRRASTRCLTCFLRWVDSPAGRRHGLAARHFVRARLEYGDQLHIVVTPEWLAQTPEKRLDDLTHWRIVWDYCLNAFTHAAPVRLVVKDGASLMIGGSAPGETAVVWLEV